MKLLFQCKYVTERMKLTCSSCVHYTDVYCTLFVPGIEEAVGNKTEVPLFMQIDEDCDLRYLVRKGISENVIFEKETGGDEEAGLDDSQQRGFWGEGSKLLRQEQTCVCEEQ